MTEEEKLIRLGITIGYYWGKVMSYKVLKSNTLNAEAAYLDKDGKTKIYKLKLRSVALGKDKIGAFGVSVPAETIFYKIF